MNQQFSCIAIIGKPRDSSALSTHKILYHWMIARGYSVIIEKKISKELCLNVSLIGNIYDIGNYADLAVVVGGDGNMLGAAKILAHYDIKVIGINRGHLGFLTDLNHKNILLQISYVLEGEYVEEKRFLLETTVYKIHSTCHISTALNEVVLHSSKIAYLIEFEVYIDDHFAFSQRSDGIIISTPTGSTAYSLSAGGPILVPYLEAITIVPMFSNLLSARPLVLGSNSKICIKFEKRRRNGLEISCDSQFFIKINQSEEALINRSNFSFQLIHPKNYSYFHILNTKLGWYKKLLEK